MGAGGTGGQASVGPPPLHPSTVGQLILSKLEERERERRREREKAESNDGATRTGTAKRTMTAKEAKAAAAAAKAAAKAAAEAAAAAEKTIPRGVTRRPWATGSKAKPVEGRRSESTNDDDWEHYASQTEAARKCGINVGSVSQCVSGKQSEAGGFKFRYAKKPAPPAYPPPPPPPPPRPPTPPPSPGAQRKTHRNVQRLLFRMSAFAPQGLAKEAFPGPSDPSEPYPLQERQERRKVEGKSSRGKGRKGKGRKGKGGGSGGSSKKRSRVARGTGASGEKKRGRGAAVVVGDLVEAQYGNDADEEWFAGTVAAVNTAERTCDVHYEDGDKEVGKAWARVRHRA